MSHDAPAYGLWSLVVLNSTVFLIFAFTFFKPRTARDWRTFGALGAFIVACGPRLEESEREYQKTVELMNVLHGATC